MSVWFLVSLENQKKKKEIYNFQIARENPINSVKEGKKREKKS